MALAQQTINLLPEEKIKLIRVQRINALVVGGSIVVIVVVVAVVILLTSAIGATQFALDQKKKEIVNTKNQIHTIDTLQDGTSLEANAVTLQNQLAKLRDFYAARDKKQFAKSLQRIGQITPPTVSFSSASVDSSGVVTLSGSAKSYDEIGRFVEALKDDGSVINIPANATADGVSVPTTYFTDVKLQSASFTSSGGGYSYSITYTLGSEANNV